MSKTFKQPGQVIDVTASGAPIAVGEVVVLATIVAVARVNIPDGDTGSADVEGVHELPKVSATPISQGAKVYWDGSKIVTSPSGNTLAGYAFSEALSADATVDVKLNAAS